MTPIEGDHMLIERTSDGWLASYRMGPMAGSSGSRPKLIDAIHWLERVELSTLLPSRMRGVLKGQKP